ncbi:hypothetical protein PSA7680_01853 [Pseudoruegeria aquimaris]|uniref:Uncharacterized protein n=1 Tax=Pseudoruegeria aquimaris TaxID=393663 RepID=A0A1Y5SDA8_9RHOB|nr:hypothetical protein [Pseudoruegeria aquimaris]SLN37993.1 hypothetical protein PSA7680_01853 [Pseudoruegeria aquimaris]
MRYLCALLLLPTEAFAWEFSSRPLCRLSHQNDSAGIVITHDPSIPEYRLSLDLKAGAWAPSATFGMAFEGGRALTIGTDRHAVEGTRLSVRDRGFGNVLDGLEFNTTATAFTESQGVRFSLEGAAPEVRRFRSCVAPPAPTS